MRKAYRMMGLSLATAMVLAACAPAAQPAPGEAAAPADGAVANNGDAAIQNELRVVVNSIPVDMDPPSTNDTPSIRARRMVFDSLIHQDERTLELIPGLAVAWDMPDPQTVVMELRQGVTFHNGDPFNGEAVRFSLLRAAETPAVISMAGMIEDVEVVDDYNIVIHLDMPFVPVLNALSQSQMGIVSPRAVQEAEELGIGFGDAPVGTGPFMFDEFVTGSHISLVRNDDWWGELPAFERLTMRGIPEQANRLIEIETGNADIAIDIAPIDVPIAMESPNVVLHRGPSTIITYLGFNLEQGPLTDIRVRHAIAHALNMEAIIGNAFAGTGHVAHSLLPSIAFGYESQEPFEFDLDRSRELLAEAGYPDGLELRIWYNAGNQQRADMAEMIQNQLTAVGINVIVETIEWAAYLDRTANAEHDMFILGWAAGNLDPDVSLMPLLHSTNLGAPGNRSFFVNERVDYLLEAGRQELDEEVRHAIYAELMGIVRDEAPIMFAVNHEELHFSRPGVNGFYPTPNTVFRFDQVYFD